MWSQVGAAGHEWQISIENCCSGSSLASVNAATRGTIDRLAWLPFFLKLLQVGVASTKRKPLQTIQAGHHSTNNYGWNRAQMPSSAHADFRRCWLIAEHETRPSTERVAYRVFKNLQPFRLLILRPVHHIYSLSKFKNARPLTLWVKKCQVFHKIVSHKISCGGFFDNNLSTTTTTTV